MMGQCIGTCSLCGGPVMVPSHFCDPSGAPAPAQCAHCGATKKNPYGAVVEMEKQDGVATGTVRGIFPAGVTRTADEDKGGCWVYRRKPGDPTPMFVVFNPPTAR